MAKDKYRDPRGHSLRIYADVYGSPAWASLSPHDVLAYLALLVELKGYNNGDLSLPLSRAKKCGIGHQLTLAKALRALCAVGLIAVTRRGGSTKGGQRLPNLYRLTDRECYAIPAKHLEAMPETNEWKRVPSVDHGRRLIADVEQRSAVESKAKSEAIKAGLYQGEKTKSLGHPVTVARTPRDLIGAKTRTPRDLWSEGLGHGVTLAESAENPAIMRATAEFSPEYENASHRSSNSPPLYIATPEATTGQQSDGVDVDGNHTNDQPELVAATTDHHQKAKTQKSPASALKAKPTPEADPVEKTAQGLSGEAGEVESDVVRVRDDQPTGHWCDELGEYVKPKPSKSGAGKRGTDAMVAAMLAGRSVEVAG